MFVGEGLESSAAVINLAWFWVASQALRTHLDPAKYEVVDGETRVLIRSLRMVAARAYFDLYLMRRNAETPNIVEDTSSNKKQFTDDTIFPLGKIQSCGYSLPAPAKPEAMLEATFGKHYMQTIYPTGPQGLTCRLYQECPIKWRY